jgi:hypothetical protein
MCQSPCIIKIIATSDSRWKEVDVCKMCGTMYPRGKDSDRTGKAPAKGRKSTRKGVKAPKKPAKKTKRKAAR